MRSGWWNRELEVRTQVLVFIERLLLTDPEALGLLGVEIVVLVGHVCWVRMYGAASSSWNTGVFERRGWGALDLWRESIVSLQLEASPNGGSGGATQRAAH